eukprot:GGOE01022753.1.p1 GENE.GGOE01022753.1~~GGOE01022753.1.p1  ORF type:complete len:1395 (+),score=371.01 GGOE01022753.1:226-4185(+)
MTETSLGYLQAPNALDLFVDATALVMRLHKERQITRRLSNLQWHMLFLILVWVITLIQTDIVAEYYMGAWLMATFVNPGRSADPKIRSVYDVKTTDDIRSYLAHVWAPTVWDGLPVTQEVPTAGSRLVGGFNRLTSSIAFQLGHTSTSPCMEGSQVESLQECVTSPQWTGTETIWLEGANLLVSTFGAVNTISLTNDGTEWCKDDPQKPFPASCAPGWKYFVDRCYRLFPAAMWSQGKATCASVPNGTLAAVHSVYQQRFLASLFDHSGDWYSGSSVPVYGAAWIGLRLVSDQWEWTDGTSLVYSNWAAGASGMSCGQITASTGGLWGTADCSTSLPFICEQPAAASAATVEGHCSADDYGGSVHVTQAGKSCLPWNSISSASTPYNWVGHHNYCRSPVAYPNGTDASGSWCFSADKITAYDLCVVRENVSCITQCSSVTNASALASAAVDRLQAIADGTTGFVSVQINLHNVYYELFAVLRLVFVVFPTGLVKAVARAEDMYGEHHRGSLLQVMRRHFYWQWVDWLRLSLEMLFLLAMVAIGIQLIRRYRHLAIQTGWRMASFTFSNIYDTLLYCLLWTATGFWCYVILQLPHQQSIGDGNGGYITLRNAEATILVMLALRTLRYVPLSDRAPDGGSRFLNTRLLYRMTPAIIGIVISVGFSSLFFFWVYGPVRPEFSTFGQSFASTFLSIMSRRMPLGMVFHSNGLPLSPTAPFYERKRPTVMDSGNRDWWWSTQLDNTYWAWNVFTVQVVWWLLVGVLLVWFAKVLLAEIIQGYRDHLQGIARCEKPAAPKDCWTDLYFQVLRLGHHQQHNVLTMLESRGWVEPLITEHEPSMLVQAEVTAVGGWLDVVLTLKKPHPFANKSVFTNAHDLLLVLPHWLVRRTRGGWQYWLQRINVSEEEFLQFSPSDLAQLLSESLHRCIDRHVALALRSSFESAAGDEGTYLEVPCIVQEQSDFRIAARLFGNVLQVPLTSLPIAAQQPIHLRIGDVLALTQRHPIDVPMQHLRRTRYGNLALISREVHEATGGCPYVVFRNDDPITPEDIVLLKPHNRPYWSLHEQANGNAYARPNVLAVDLARYRLHSKRAAELEDFRKRFAAWDEGAEYLLHKLGWQECCPIVQLKWKHLAGRLRNKLAFEAEQQELEAQRMAESPPQHRQQRQPLSAEDPKFPLYDEAGFTNGFGVAPVPQPSLWQAPSMSFAAYDHHQWPTEADVSVDEDSATESAEAEEDVPDFPVNNRTVSWPQSIAASHNGGSVPGPSLAPRVPFPGRPQYFEAPPEVFGGEQPMSTMGPAFLITDIPLLDANGKPVISSSKVSNHF